MSKAAVPLKPGWVNNISPVFIKVYVIFFRSFSFLRELEFATEIVFLSRFTKQCEGLLKLQRLEIKHTAKGNACGDNCHSFMAI